MNYFKLLALLCISTTYAFAAGPDLQKVLQIKPGAQLEKGLKPSETAKDFSYDVEKEKDLVKSVTIDFNSPIPAEKLLSKDTKGFCLVQPRPGHVKLDRYFFFDLETKRRYELTFQKEIKAILIQDIPGARANKECTFGSFTTPGKKK